MFYKSILSSWYKGQCLFDNWKEGGVLTASFNMSVLHSRLHVGRGQGERVRERRETLSSLSMILKMTIFQILFHYSEVFTDVRLLGSNPYSVITSAFISSFSPTYHTHAHKLKLRGIQQASVCLRSQNGIPGDSFPSTHESKI